MSDRTLHIRDVLMMISTGLPAAGPDERTQAACFSSFFTSLFSPLPGCQHPVPSIERCFTFTTFFIIIPSSVVKFEYFYVTVSLSAGYRARASPAGRSRESLSLLMISAQRASFVVAPSVPRKFHQFLEPSALRHQQMLLCFFVACPISFSYTELPLAPND